MHIYIFIYICRGFNIHTILHNIESQWISHFPPGSVSDGGPLHAAGSQLCQDFHLWWRRVQQCAPPSCAWDSSSYVEATGSQCDAVLLTVATCWTFKALSLCRGSHSCIASQARVGLFMLCARLHTQWKTQLGSWCPVAVCCFTGSTTLMQLGHCQMVSLRLHFLARMQWATGSVLCSATQCLSCGMQIPVVCFQLFSFFKCFFRFVQVYIFCLFFKPRMGLWLFVLNLICFHVRI